MQGYMAGTGTGRNVVAELILGPATADNGRYFPDHGGECNCKAVIPEVMTG